MFPYRIRHGFPGTKSTWAISSAAANQDDSLHQESLARPGFGDRKGTRREETPAKPTSSTEHYDTLSETTGLLHCSYQQIQVQGQPWCTYWKLILPASCSHSTTSNQGSQLLVVILFIIAGPQDKQKRSPIVLSVVQKCLISLFTGCSLELLLNNIFSNINSNFRILEISSLKSVSINN